MTSEGSINKPIKVVIIGGAGNVGRGICTSCSYNSEWQMIGVDPNFKQCCDVPSNEMNNIDTISSCIEDVDTTVFQSWFISKDGDGGSTQKQHVEFIVTNDDGNRDNYTKNSNLGHDNNVRFEMLVQRIADTRDQVTNYNKNNVDDDNVSVHISYIGGSWTRLQPTDDKNVNELSPVKKEEVLTHMGLQRLVPNRMHQRYPQCIPSELPSMITLVSCPIMHQTFLLIEWSDQVLRVM